MLTIRFAQPADAEIIARISRQTFYETFAAQNTKQNMDKFMDEMFTSEQLQKEVGEPGNFFLLVYDDDKPVGYARLRENNNPPELGVVESIEIARIYALAGSIGKGVGKLLMQATIDMARQKNKPVIWLGVWQENERAISFYEKWGFEKFATHIFMLGDDPQQDWLMKKILTPV